MKTLYTEREKLRYLNVFVFIIFILYVIMDIYYDGFYTMVTKNLLIFIEVFGIIEVIILSIWYPNEYKKKRAKKNGQVYEGRITDIQLKKRTGNSLSRISHIYTMTVECNIEGNRIIMEIGNYMENPMDYVPKDYKCKVFYYKGKCYLEDFFLRDKNAANSEQREIDNENQICIKALDGELDNEDISGLIKYPIEKLKDIQDNEKLKVILERDSLFAVRSKNIILTRTLVFSAPIPHFCCFVEVHIKSRRAYNSSDFDLNAKIKEFMDMKPISDTYSDEEFISECIELVKSQMISKDNEIEIEKVYVAFM